MRAVIRANEKPAASGAKGLSGVAAALLIACCLLATAAAADAPQRVVLNDGSEIVASLRSLEDGVYTFESDSLGTVRIPKARVLRIENWTDTPAAPTRTTSGPPQAVSPEVQDLQLRMLGDPALIGALMELQSSPEMQAILQDPEILRAVARGDLEALRRNPKMQKLMADPRVQRITRKLAPSAADPTEGARPTGDPRE